jgi:hypothetical protein
LRVLLTMTTPTYESPLARELKKISGLRVKLAEPLARYASMKIGGPADYFIEVERAAALAQLLPLLKRHRADLFSRQRQQRPDQRPRRARRGHSPDGRFQAR